MTNILDNYKLKVFQAPADDVRKTVQRNLRIFNHKTMPARFPHPDEEYQTQARDLILRDETGKIIAGLVGNILWDGLHIQYIWVDEDLRGSGIGSALIERAESEARSAGAHYMMLTTFEFQARPFYEKLGFRVIGEVQGYPPGHTFYFMQKDLKPDED